MQFHQLELKQAFKIAHGSSKTRQVLRLSWRGAIGEAPFVPYYPDTVEDVRAWLEALAWNGQPTPQHGPKVGRLALDALYHDALAKLKNLPLHELFGWPNPSGGVKSYRSVGLDDSMENILAKVAEHSRSFDQIKLKLGSGNLDFDEELLSKTREQHPTLTLCADVNSGWSVQDTLKMLPRMSRLNYAFLEQPVSAEAGTEYWKELHLARTSTDFPIYADESLQSADDVMRLSKWIQGVNVKLLKAGSLGEAFQMIQVARSFRLRVLVGCMIESSLGITTAAHLAGLADDVDLDGALYLANDDYEGVKFGPQGVIFLPTGKGIGGQWK